MEAGPEIKPHTRNWSARQLPSPISRAELGHRMKRAIRAAGYPTQVEVVRTIRKAYPGTPFDSAALSAITSGHLMPGFDRVMLLMIVLGLNPRVILPELFDEEGNAINRQAHPDLFLKGYREFGAPAGDSESHPQDPDPQSGRAAS